MKTKGIFLILTIAAIIAVGCFSGKKEGLVDSSVNKEKQGDSRFYSKPAGKNKPSMTPTAVCTTDTSKGDNRPLIRAY